MNYGLQYALSRPRDASGGQLCITRSLNHLFRPAPFARRWKSGTGSQSGSAYGTYRAVWHILHGIEGSEKEPVAFANRADEFHNGYNASGPMAEFITYTVSL